VPPGTYKLKFEEGWLDGVEVKAAETTEVALGSIRIKAMSEPAADVYEKASGKKVATILSGPNQAQVPPGVYKVQIGASVIDDVTVKAGEEVVLE
jgi:hypothetical protein